MADKKDAVALTIGQRYPVLESRQAACEIAEAIQSTAQSGAMSLGDLTKVKVPSGGGLTWEVETLTGPQGMQELECIILLVKSGEKAWWQKTDPDGERPSCVSHDGLYGIGNNTVDATREPGRHECAQCLWNQFGSDRKSRAGKDCKDSAILFFVMPGGAMPRVMTVPPTSLRELSKYRMRLVDGQITKPYGAVTRLSLTKEKSVGGQVYAKMVFTFVSKLSAEEVEMLRPMEQACAALLPAVQAELTQAG